MATDPKKKAQQTVKSPAKRQVKKAAKKNPVGFLIALVAIVIIIAIVLVVMYFTVPSFKSTVNNFISPESSSTNNGANNSGGNNSGNNSGGKSDLVIGEGDLKVHFMDVGQGDGIYIQFPDGNDMLIDCGNKSSGYDFNKTMAYLDALNPDKAITHLMLTHGDEDHVDHLDEVLSAYAISNIYMPNILAEPTNETLKAAVNNLPAEKLAMFTDPNTLTSATYARFFIAALSEENCKIVLNMDDDDEHNNIVISDNSTYELKFYCMTVAGWAANKLNDAHAKNAISPVGILTYNNKRIVLTGDSNEDNEPEIAARIGHIDCDVLKVAHHGSETSSLPVFLDAITCEYAVFSCNVDGNTFHHPRQEVIDRLIERNYLGIYRTDLNGTIVATVDKDGKLTIVPERTATKEQEENGVSKAETTAIEELKKQYKNGEITEEEYKKKHAEMVGW